MRIKSTRRVLLTAYPDPPYPNGLITPSPISVTKRISSERVAIWNMNEPVIGGGFNLDRQVIWDVEPSPLTNYIEIPFMQFARFRGEDATTHDFLTHYDTVFNGMVRLWESGTVEFIGQAKTNAPLGRSYQVWEGDSPTDVGGQLHTVITLPGDDTYYDVNFAVHPAAGKSIHVIAPYTLNVGGTTDGNRVVLWSYSSGGWIFPINFNIDSDAGIMGAIDRSGTNSTCVGSSGTWTTILNNANVFSYLDDNDWDNRTSFINEYSAVGVSGTFNLSRAIPDSASQGVLWFCTDAQGGTNQAWGTFAVGPILRSAYDPVIQQGIDPL